MQWEEQEDWCRQWAAQPNPAKRYEMLTEARAQSLPWAESAAAMWERRFGTTGKTVPDGYFVWWMDARFAGSRGQGLFGGGKMKKVYAAGLGQLGLDWAAAGGCAAQALLKADLRQMAEQYIRLCRQDKQYNTVAFGLMGMSEEAGIAKIAGDLVMICADYPAKVGLAAEYQPLRHAAAEAFCSLFPTAQLPEELRPEWGGQV